MGGRGCYKQTQSHSHPCTRVHIAAHRTLAQSAMDKKIIPLSFLECSLLHPPHPFRTHPSSPPPHFHTLRKHWLLSPSCDSPGPQRPDLLRYINTVLSFSTPVNPSSERAVLGPSQGSSGPEYQVASKSNLGTLGQMCHLSVKTHQEVSSVPSPGSNYRWNPGVDSLMPPEGRASKLIYPENSSFPPRCFREGVFHRRARVFPFTHLMKSIHLSACPCVSHSQGVTTRLSSSTQWLIFPLCRVFSLSQPIHLH